MHLFNDVPFYKVNREERHFGFLVMAALICCKSSRAELIKYINRIANSNLHCESLNVYAEVSLFRDYWFNLGDATIYDINTHKRRFGIFTNMLAVMNVDCSAIDTEDVFWTGKPKESKLYYPGKWTREKIHKSEYRLGLKKRELWRLRWACNAKPDILLEDEKTMVFVEIKVESGFGHGYEGYSQRETQEDIINLGKATIPKMGNKVVKLTSLTQTGNEMVWNEIKKIINNIEPSESDFSMITRHLNNMPNIDDGQPITLTKNPMILD